MASDPQYVRSRPSQDGSFRRSLLTQIFKNRSVGPITRSQKSHEFLEYIYIYIKSGGGTFEETKRCSSSGRRFLFLSENKVVVDDKETAIFIISVCNWFVH